MKQLLIIPLAILTSCCCTNKNTASKEKEANLNTIAVSTINSDCPTDGKCTVEILKNKSLKVLTDEIGAIYYRTEDNNSTSVIVYKYNKNIPKDVQDADYREEIVFEIPNSETKINKENFTLQNTKMLFGRFCFCRGQTGYYKVDQGNLELENKNNQIHFKLDFTVTKVPQTIKSIEASIQ